MRNLFFLTVFGLFLSFGGNVQKSFAAAPPNSAVVTVNGLVCDFCAIALEKVFQKQEEVSTIDVDLSEKTVAVYFHEGKSLDDKALSRLIEDSGYDVQKISRNTPTNE